MAFGVARYSPDLNLHLIDKHFLLHKYFLKPGFPERYCALDLNFT